MRIAVTYDNEHNLKPLDEADIVGIIDEENKVVEQYENEGKGSKEMTMGLILNLNADAIIVKERFLCPGSYGMSLGRIRYIPVNAQKLEEVLSKLEEIKKGITDELDEQYYAEYFEEENNE
ncbi:MAG: hypothetical protein OWQ54_04685 [Sulfolobaceae archaeon]|nr:hypothetical protein [Sulfolobaceae archaeon]